RINRSNQQGGSPHAKALRPLSLTPAMPPFFPPSGPSRGVGPSSWTQECSFSTGQYCLDARMVTVVPQSVPLLASKNFAQDLGDGLAALLEFTGAEAGWIGLSEREGLTFPVRLGTFA